MSAISARTDAERVQFVQNAILAADAALRARHPWLRHQDAIGMAILVFALAGMLASAFAYREGLIPAWFCVPLVAVLASLTHELEHDLIHWMYFRKRAWLHHLMLALVWLARPSTINPWLRRHLHFNHHKHSGTEADIEERAITNGEPWGLLRLLMTADAGVSVLVRAARADSARKRWRHLYRAALAYFPLGWVHWPLWWGFLAIHGMRGIAHVIGIDPPWPQVLLGFLAWLDFLVVVWIAPNVLRSFCLHLVSSNMHYYGDVTPGNLLQQCQVLTAWWLWPAQLFCCNFGGTHAIHHFVVKQPFYLRQWVAPQAVQAMRAVGVRFDDFASLNRGNRWTPRNLKAEQ